MPAPQTVNLIDPGGNVRATLPSPASPEALLRAALGMTPGDEFMVYAEDEQTWELGVFWVRRPLKLQPLGVRCGHVPDQSIQANREGMVQTAWLELLDEGWQVGG